VKPISQIGSQAGPEKYGIHISPGSKLMCRKIAIGVFTRINGPIVIKGSEKCVIGKYCAFGDGIRIITNSHNLCKANIQGSLDRRHSFGDSFVSKGPVVIGNNVWIGDAAIILSGVNISDGAVIGAGSVVTRDIPPFAVAVGNPARVIKKRFSEKIITQLLQVRWWDWSEEKIARNRYFFELNLVDNPDIDLFQIIKP